MSEADSAKIKFRYTAGEDSQLKLTVNSVVLNDGQPVDFPATGGWGNNWQESSELSVSLKTGLEGNTISLENVSTTSAANIDNIQILYDCIKTW